MAHRLPGSGFWAYSSLVGAGRQAALGGIAAPPIAFNPVPALETTYGLSAIRVHQLSEHPDQSRKRNLPKHSAAHLLSCADSRTSGGVLMKNQ